MSNLSIFGKLAKEIKSNWSVVPGSIKKLDEKLLSSTLVTCYQSTYNDKLVARVTIGSQYVDFTVDATCNLTVGELDPASIRVLELTNGEKTITRLRGKML